jgi:Zn-dependent peptidase ImmA (M78 family)
MPNLVRLLEKNGVVIGIGKVDADNFDAFSQQRNLDGRPFMFLSTDKSIAARSRFDAAHEIAHIILHGKVDERILNTPAELKLIESHANYFASAFLMPENEFCEDLVAPSLDCFKGMKSRWKTSIAAMIMRCKSLGIIDEDQTKRLWINLNRRDWRTQEPLDDSLELEQPKLLSQSIKMIVDGGVVTKQQLLDDLCLPQQDIEELCALPSGFFEEDFGQIISFAKLKTDSRQPTKELAQPSGDGDVKIIPFSTAS